MLAGNWEDEPDGGAAHYSAGATAERGAVAVSGLVAGGAEVPRMILVDVVQRLDRPGDRGDTDASIEHASSALSE